MPVQKGKLKEEDYLRIQTNYAYLQEEIDAKCLALHLFSKDVITMNDKKEIEQSKRTDVGNGLLLDMILHSGPGNSYNVFIEVLEELYPHVIETLQNTNVEMSPPETPYHWFDQVKASTKNYVIKDDDACRIASTLGSNWELLMYRLGIRPVEMEKEKSKTPNSTLCITHLLIKWRQRVVGEANIQNLMSELKGLEASSSSSMTIDWEGLRDIILSIDKKN